MRYTKGVQVLNACAFLPSFGRTTTDCVRLARMKLHFLFYFIFATHLVKQKGTYELKKKRGELVQLHDSTKAPFVNWVEQIICRT